MKSSYPNSRIGSWLEALEGRRLLASTIFISDLQPATTPINGWGPIELDHSNGETAAHDGHVLSLNGVTYAKGLGVHAASEVRYDLAVSSGFTFFQSQIGIDDEVASNGRVNFQVWLDSEKVFDSGVMTGSSATQMVNIPIANLNTRLRLVVTNSGDGNAFDHADWADAKLVADSGTPSVQISSLTPISARNGWGPFERNQSNGESAANDGHQLTLDGVAFNTGLGVHAGSDLTYNIGGLGFTSFISSVGVDDEVGSNGSVMFQVFVDGVMKFDSGFMLGSSDTEGVNVDVTGASTLRLVVTDSNDGKDFDHADWANARLSKEKIVPAPLLSISLDEYNRFRLNWTKSPDPDVTYILDRKLGLYGNWNWLSYQSDATYGDGSTTYGDGSTFAGNTTYYYRVRVRTADNVWSQYSNEVSGTTTAEMLPGPGSNASLSWLGFVVNSNGWGPVERDRSNGEQGPADGRPIGNNIGVHANSDITYQLNGHWKRFTSTIGIDDEVGNRGSVVFQVYLDGVKAFDSGVMTGNSPNQMIDLNTTGKTLLRLVVTDAGDAPDFDHADWFFPLLYLS